MVGIKKSHIVSQIEDLIAPIANEQLVEVVQIEFNQGGRVGQLRILIDKEAGVTVSDCALFSKEVSALLDAEGVIESEFNLEVSSPGFDRPLTKSEDFTRFLGHKVLVNLSGPLAEAPDDIRRRYAGVIAGFENETLKVKTADGNEVSIPESLIGKANLDD